MARLYHVSRNRLSYPHGGQHSAQFLQNNHQMISGMIAEA